ncbi:PIN domain-containing protein [Yinghuangia aomiensis]
MAVIFFDSNILHADIDDERFDVIRAIARTDHRVCIPAVVRDELVARKVIAHRATHASLMAAAAKFGRNSPWIEAAPLAPDYDEALAREHWKGVYAREFEVVPTPPGVADEALAREAFCDKPAKPDENKKGGARDAAIWLTVVEFLRCNPQTQVYFVSNNTKDFGDGTSFPPQLEQDLGPDRPRFTLLTSLEAVIAAVTKPAEVPQADRAAVFEAPLASEDTKTRVSAAAEYDRCFRNGWSAVDLDNPGGTRYPQVHVSRWVGTPLAELIDVSNPNAYRIGDDTWYIATARWALVGLAAQGPSYGPGTPTVMMTGTVWRTRMLFSSIPGEVPVVIKSVGIEDPGRGDGPCNNTLTYAATLWHERYSSGELLLKDQIERHYRWRQIQAFINTLPDSAPDADIPPLTPDTAAEAAGFVAQWLAPSRKTAGGRFARVDADQADGRLVPPKRAVARPQASQSRYRRSATPTIPTSKSRGARAGWPETMLFGPSDGDSVNDRYDQIDFDLPSTERLGFALGSEVREVITAHLKDVHPALSRVTDELMTWVRGTVGHIRNEAAVALVNHAVNDFQDLADALMQGEGRNAARVTRSLFEHLVNLCEVSATPDSARRYVAHKAVSAQILSRMTRGLSYLKGSALKAEAHRLRKLRNASASDYTAALGAYGSGFRRNWAADNLRDRATRFGYGADYDTYSFLSQVAHGSHGACWAPSATAATSSCTAPASPSNWPSSPTSKERRSSAAS